MGGLFSLPPSAGALLQTLRALWAEPDSKGQLSESRKLLSPPRALIFDALIMAGVSPDRLLEQVAVSLVQKDSDAPPLILERCAARCLVFDAIHAIDRYRVLGTAVERLDDLGKVDLLDELRELGRHDVGRLVRTFDSVPSLDRNILLDFIAMDPVENKEKMSVIYNRIMGRVLLGQYRPLRLEWEDDRRERFLASHFVREAVECIPVLVPLLAQRV
jgi:hypothetical protein